MQNQEKWKPTKFELAGGVLRGSRDPALANAASRVNTDLIAAHYQAAVKAHVRGDVLDLGCGRVPLYSLYRDAATSVTCVDWDESPHDTDHADVHADLNEPLPLESARYDTILLTDVLEHIYRPHALLGEVARLLRPGGRVIIGTPFLLWVHEAPHDYYRYTRFALARLVEEAGLEVLTLEEMGGWPEVVADLVTRQAVGRGRPGRLVARLLGWWLRRRRVRRFSLRTRETFCLGYLTVARKPGGDAAGELAP